MESIEAFPDGEWDCIRRIFANDHEEHEHDLFFTTPQFPLLLDGDDELNIVTQPTFCAAPEAGENEHMFYSLDAHHHNSNSSQYYISQESSSNCSGDDTVFIANPGSINYYFSYPDHVLANDACVYSMDEKNTIASFVPSNADIVMEECAKLCEDTRGDHRLENSECNQMEPIHVSPTKQLQLKRKLDVPPADYKLNNGFQIHKKKPRVLKDGQGCMKTSWSKKNKKHGSKGEEAEETNATGSDGQSSSSNMSEDDNTSKSALNSNGKTRASRGSATDPQSLYARKRRERINERLRILQTLVPNGTKVDISTMLEDAVNYVKFLQLQIKLLSSDDLWMYAPLAYNGLDIGLNFNMKNFLPL